MQKSIRTKRHHHIRLAKLEAGYKEQRGWLGVGMQRIIVTLKLQGWAELPIVVTYAAIDPDGSTKVNQQRFTRSQIDEARKLFKTAGQPNCWPNTTVQTLNEKGAHDE